MNCNCRWWNAFLALVVVVFTIWTPATWTKWLVVAAGAIILAHAFGCCKCSCGTEAKPKKKR